MKISKPLFEDKNNLRVLKYQALGNSYLILDPTRQSSPSRRSIQEKRSLAKFVRVLCNEGWGIGANGLLFGPISTRGDVFSLRIINSDGTPAGFSGNGIRIFARYLLDAGYILAGKDFKVEVIEENNIAFARKHVIPVKIFDDKKRTIRVSVPLAPVFGPSGIVANPRKIKILGTLDKKLKCSVLPLRDVGARLDGAKAAWTDSTLVYIGNPHCVTFLRARDHLPSTDQLNAVFSDLREIAFRPSRKDSSTSVFREGSNLQWVRVASRSHIKIAIFERGEGPTLASGSSAIAAASAAYARGLVNPVLRVEMPGGVLHVSISGSASAMKTVALSGFAVRILDGHVSRTAIDAAR